MSEESTPQRSGSYVSGESSTDPMVIETARKVRRVGYIISVILVLWLCIPVIYFVVAGMLSGQMWDPYTKQPVPADGNYGSVGCEETGLALIERKIQKQSVPKDEVAAWNKACSERFPTLRKAIE